MLFNSITDWPEPNKHVSLSDNDIHVWGASFNVSEYSRLRLLNLLSIDELTKAKRYYFLKDKIRFVTFRSMLRVILGNYLNLEPEKVQFEYGPFGRPILRVNQGSLNFSVSHSNNLALFAFSLYTDLGIDLEMIDYNFKFDGISNNFFSDQENIFLDRLTPKNRLKGFFSLWTHKESFSKINGAGLPQLLSSPSLYFPHSSVQFFPHQSYIGTLTAKDHIKNLAFWRWPIN